MGINMYQAFEIIHNSEDKKIGFYPIGTASTTQDDPIEVEDDEVSSGEKLSQSLFLISALTLLSI